MMGDSPSVPGATMKFYDINGRTKRKLREAMDRRNLEDTSGDHVWAVTWAEITRTSNEEWTPPAVVEISEMSVTLPRWIPRKGVSESLQSEWAKLIEAMVAHETIHVSMFYEDVAKINAAIVDGPPEQWEQRWETANNEMKNRQIEYDRVTKHGATEGVVWSRN